MPVRAPAVDEKQRKVFNLCSVYLTTIIFGHYADLGLPHRIQRILRLYCTIAPPIWLILKIFLTDITYIPMFCYRLIEFFVYYVASFYRHANYVDEYYSFVYLVDGGTIYARKLYAILGKTAICFPLLTYVEVIMILVKEYLTSNFTISTLLDVPSRCFVLLSRVSLQLAFSLLYCRVRCFRHSLTTCELGANKDYAGIYSKIYDGLDNMGILPSLQITFQTLAWVLQSFWLTTSTAAHFKNIDEVNIANLVWSIIFFGIDFMIVFYPCIVQELVHEEMEQCKCFIADQQITCTDEATRVKLQALQRQLRERPLRYAVWRVCRLGAGVPLALVALGANYVICALQFTHVFSGNATDIVTLANATY